MINLSPSDYHHFFQITITQGEPALHINEEHDHWWRRAKSFKMEQQLRGDYQHCKILFLKGSLNDILTLFNRCDRTPMEYVQNNLLKGAAWVSCLYELVHCKIGLWLFLSLMYILKGDSNYRSIISLWHSLLNALLYYTDKECSFKYFRKAALFFCSHHKVWRKSLLTSSIKAIILS